MKKVWLFVTVIAMVVSLLAGCQSGGNTQSTPDSGSNDSSQSTESAPVYEAPLVKDLNGYEFVIARADLYGESDRPKEEIGYSDLNDAFLERNNMIEDQYKCKVIYEYYNPVSFFEDVSMSLMAGDKVADVLMPTQFTFGKFVNADLLLDLRTMPNLRLDAPYWIQSIEQMCKVGSKSYGAASPLAEVTGHALGLYFNKNLIQKLNLENPYDLVRNDQWTWDKFESMLNAAIKDQDNNGVWDENDMWGMTGGSVEQMEAFYISSGNEVLAYTEDHQDIPQYLLKETQSVNAMLRMKDIFQSPGSYYNPNMDYNLMMDLFMKGNILFFGDNVYHYDVIRDMSDDYGLVPMPKGPNATEYRSLLSHNTAVIAIPNTIEDAETTSLLLEALSYAAREEQEVYLDHVESMFWRDEESREMCETYIIPNMYGSMHYLWHNMSQELTEAFDITIAFPVIFDRSMEVATRVEEYGDMTQAFLDETYAKE